MDSELLPVRQTHYYRKKLNFIKSHFFSDKPADL